MGRGLEWRAALQPQESRKPRMKSILAPVCIGRFDVEIPLGVTGLPVVLLRKMLPLQSLPLLPLVVLMAC